MSADGPKSERRLLHSVLRRMGGPFTLPLLGGSLLAAAAVGIHLGESAVELIDPVHFQGPAIHPRDRGAALDEPSLSRARPRPDYADLYGWHEGRAARLAECGDCGFTRSDARAYSATVPYFGEPEPPPERADVARDEAWDSAGPRDSGFDEASDPVVLEEKRLERYAHFPLTYEEAALPADAGDELVHPKDPDL